MVEAAITKLFEAIAELAGADIAGQAQRDVLAQLERAKAQLDAEAARRLRESDRQTEYRTLGYKSAAAMLVGRTRCSWSEAYRRVRVAKHVEAMPEFAALWAAGSITTGHVEVAVRIRHRAKADEHFAEFEPALARIATVGTPKDIADSGRAWRDALDDHLDRDGSDRQLDEDYERQLATWARTVDDLGMLDATFAPEAATLIGKAISLAYQRGHRAGDPRSPQRQRADALVAIFEAYLAGSPRTGNRPHLVVVSDEATLAGDAVGRAHSSDGTRLAPETIRRIACDAFLQHVLVDGNSVPLMMGRTTRLFTPDQYRAMVARDFGCRGPNCNAPPDQCETHHLDGWAADQGHTDLDHGVLLCRGNCHRLAHEGHVTIEGDANGRLDFYDRNGNHLGHSEPRVPPEAIPTKQGKQRAAELQAIQQRVSALQAATRPRSGGA